MYNMDKCGKTLFGSNYGNKTKHCVSPFPSPKKMNVVYKGVK